MSLPLPLRVLIFLSFVSCYFISLQPALAPKAKGTTPTSSVWLTDAKKFNAQRIRRRMKEQQERFGSKGKENSSIASSYQSSLASKSTNEEHALQDKGEMEQSSPNPRLTIAVTMSEEEEDPVEESHQTNLSVQDESTAANVSAWAMMEHYIFAKDNGVKESKDSSYNFSFESSSDSEVLREMSSTRSTPSQGIFVPQSDFKRYETTPVRIGWRTDENGELVQNSYYSFDSEGPSSRHQLTPGVVRDANSEAQQDSPQSNDTVDEDDFFPNPLVAAASQAQPTPARLRKEWKDERVEDSSLPTSLLQESMIQSDYHRSEATSRDFVSRDRDDDPYESIDVPEDTSSVDFSASHTENVTQLSILSLQPSDAGTIDLASQESTAPLILAGSQRSADPVLGKDVGQKNDEGNFAYLARIEELEHNLKEQRSNTVNVQSKMKERVVELEQALRATTATPRGTILQENPLKTLLDRNQTLVKEVRFADQTCVELSSKVSAFEAENEILKQQMSGLESEKEDLRHELNFREESYIDDLTEKQEIIDRLTNDLERTQHAMDVFSKTPTVEQTTQTLSTRMEEKDAFQLELEEAKDSLELARTDLEEERSRSRAQQKKWKEEAKAQLLKIENLEDALEKATENMYLYKDGPTSPRLLDADKRVFDLEKELAHAKASIVAMRRESEKMLSTRIVNHDNEGIKIEDKEIISTFQSALSRMHDHYKRLDNQVKDVVDNYAERLENLAQTVSYLRSSLQFETESVSTQVREETPQRMMDATICSIPLGQEDEMLELMEEARSPPKMKFPHIDEASSDVEELSRLFSDDITLESIVRGGSVESSASYVERWKAPLEAAIKECRRVRDRSSKLKEEVERHKATIGNLEAENGRLSLNASRKKEEYDLVEKALQEAKERIEEIQSLLDIAIKERDRAQEAELDNDEKAKIIEEKLFSMQEQLNEAYQKQEDLEKRFVGVNDDLKECNSSLLLAKQSSAEYASRCRDLLSEVESKESEVLAKKDEEMASTSQALQQAQKKIDGLRQSNKEVLSKLGFESNERSKFETMTADLQASQQRLLSDTEDRILESQYQQEDMRKERAELRAKLSRKEKEYTSLKEVFTGFKTKVQSQLDQKDSVIKSFQSERSEVAFQIEQLVSARQELFEVLESVGACDDIVKRISSADEESSVDETIYMCIRELSYWRDIIPSVGNAINTICQRQHKFDSLEHEAESLQEELFRLQGLEIDYKKQVEDEKLQNEKLFTLLRQAELEMERSAKQIRDMSGALSRLQQQEAEANEKAKVFENECTQHHEDLLRTRQDFEGERTDTEQRVSEATAALKNKEGQLSEVNEQV